MGILKILSHPQYIYIYIYIIFEKLFFLQSRLSGAFQTRLFSYKEFDLLYVVSWLVVLLDYVCVSVYTLGFGTLTGILRDIMN